jgi:hypothetical protein
MQQHVANLETVSAEDLTSATGGFWDRALAVVDHDALVGTRVGNRIGDRLGLAPRNQWGDNFLGEVGEAAGLMWGALHGEATALVHPSVGDALLKRWGGDEDIKGPHR